MTVRVLIADDQALVRAGFQMILDAEDDIEVVGEAADGREAVEVARRAQARRRPDGHPHAGAGRHRGDARIVAARGRAARRGCSCSPRSTSTSTSTRRCAPGRAASCSRTAAGAARRRHPRRRRRRGAAGAVDHAPADRGVRRARRPTATAAAGASTSSPRASARCSLVARGLSNAEIAAELVVERDDGQDARRAHPVKLGLRDRVQAVVLAYESRPGDPGPRHVARLASRGCCTSPSHPTASAGTASRSATYKESEGKRRGMGWRGLTRHTLVPGGSVAAGFEQRYFEIEPGGYSSLEKHEHVHVVVTLRGEGRVLVGDRVVELGPHGGARDPAVGGAPLGQRGRRAVGLPVHGRRRARPAAAARRRGVGGPEGRPRHRAVRLLAARQHRVLRGRRVVQPPGERVGERVELDLRPAAAPPTARLAVGEDLQRPRQVARARGGRCRSA